MEKIRIAIDGPAGAGKSSVSRLVADKLGYEYIDTGAIYRCLALLMNNSTELENLEGIKGLLEDFEVSFMIVDGINRVYLNKKDVTGDIRTEKISMLASSVSAIPFVREALLEMQKRYAAKGGVVMEGRDIGTVIMPDAELKIFLTASPEKRAGRRMLDLKAKGAEIQFEKLVEEIKKRDEQDANRKVAPLKKADDAILVDNTNIDLVKTADIIVSYVKNRKN
ncbi:MAG TPA: (d)CMP kinase [bacterium]|nr:(d)CMP kinase [bacterium]HPS30413.1 (d)CMP kinase [bacterium]